MSLNKAIITPAEADVYLANYPDWLVLTDDVKTDNIAKASVYMQTTWSCVDVDWDDSLTIPDELKEACAYYALANSSSNLYTSADGSSAPVGNVVEQTDKVGSLLSTTKWDFENYVTSSNVLEYPNTLMDIYCTSTSKSGSVLAIRT